MKFFWLLPLLCVAASAQQNEAGAKPGPETEEQELNRALGEAGSSPMEFIRALEKHLERYADTKRRPEIERALVKAAMETKDNRRITLYGEKVLTREPDDLQILERVTRALLVSDARDTSERALKYARHYEDVVNAMRSKEPPGRMSKGQWQDELDRGLARALVLEARATGNLGSPDQAISLARRSFDVYPMAESAREIGRWLVRTGREADAIAPMADAFTIADPRNTDQDRAKDRVRIGDLYRKLHGSEKGLGDLILESYDRTSGLLAARRLRMRENDPNSEATQILEFTLTGLGVQPLKLVSLRGKTVVFDFWATWCGPCRVQHPLYEEVKKRFAGNRKVVFLSINTDEDRSLVEPFLKEQKWDQQVYFEDGLSRLLAISSIPTTIVMNGNGEVVSRMNGFLPGRFVDMLTDRIHEALRN